MVRRTCPPNVSHLALLGNNSHAFLCIVVLEFYLGTGTYWVAAGFTSLKECISATGKGIVFLLVGQKPEQKILRHQVSVPKSTLRGLRNIQEHSELPDLPTSCAHGLLRAMGHQGTARLVVPGGEQSTQRAWMYVGSCNTRFAFLHLLFTYIAKLVYKLISLCLNNSLFYSQQTVCICSSEGESGRRASPLHGVRL